MEAVLLAALFLAQGQEWKSFNQSQYPVAVFVGVMPRSIPGVNVAVENVGFANQGKPCIMLCLDDKQSFKYGPALDDDDIRHIIDAYSGWAERQVSRQRAVPFQEPHVQPDAEEVGTVVPKEAKAYSLTPLYQQMYTMNNGRSRFNVKTGIDADWPMDLRVSGGFAGLSGWRSEKRILLPKGGKIAVWSEDTDVRAFSLVPRVRWQFPLGTVTYDILSTDKGVCEVRSRTKTEDGWMSKVLLRNEDAAPNGYHGAGRACASCHDRAGGLAGTRSIYLHAIWGDDGVFSWRPYDASGNTLSEWPIETR